MKSQKDLSIVKLARLAVLLLLIAGAPACSLFKKSDYSAITPEELSLLADSIPDMQKRNLAQNEGQRKQLIDQIKKAFSLAQAAEGEGLHKSDRFVRRRKISEDQALANEFTKRDPSFTLPQEQLTSYYEANKAEFEADLALIIGNSTQQTPDEQKEILRLQWAEMKLRAAKGREAGIDKEPGFKAQLKVNIANVLANYYSELLEDRFKPSAEEKAKYIAEHPEADLERIRTRAQELLDRLKKGESFEDLATEYNEDATRGTKGDLDWFPKGRMDPEFETAAFAMEKGQVSQELLKTKFGFHIIRVDDRREMQSAPASGPAPTGAPAGEKEYEIRARHIFLSTQEADALDGKLVQEKAKRAIEDATLKYPVAAPADFQVKVAGLNRNSVPGVGGGDKGTMRPVVPGQN